MVNSRDNLCISVEAFVLSLSVAQQKSDENFVLNNLALEPRRMPESPRDSGSQRFDKQQELYRDMPNHEHQDA